ncbi:MAG: SpoIID/LytB domain-containing protein [Clostridiales bacterium]|nr:SpoIID/LytB domain-containing protein [Clostridiales bacterium]
MNNKWSRYLVRAVCMLLAALMVIGFVFMILPSKATSKGYAIQYPADLMVRIGIAYGSGAPASYEVSSPGGFSLGYVHQKQFTSVFTYNASSLMVCQADHLVRTDDGYEPAQEDSVDIGGYHIEFDIDPMVADFETQFADIADLLSEYGLPVYPAFVNKTMKVRAGCYKTLESVTKAMQKITSAHRLYGHVATPSESGVTLINPDTNRVVFQFDGGSGLLFGLQAGRPYEDRYYITAPNGYAYAGTMQFERTATGLCVVNVLPIERYVEGVLPHEISSSWNREAQKAFAVAVRSYTICNLNKHEKTYGFDLCNTTECQVYGGVKGVNTTVKECVSATKSQVLSYHDRPFSAYYSSSTGGCTASAYDVWGGTSFPYLAGVATPWEQYENYPGGSWRVEVSGAKLYDALKSKGYTGLTGSVSSININSFASGSTYVNSITFTDVNGKSILISKSDRIRQALSSYLKSANFVVERGERSVSVTDFKLDVDFTRPAYTNGVNVLTFFGEKMQKQGEQFMVAGARASTAYTNMDSFMILSSTGAVKYDRALMREEVLPDINSASVTKTTRTVKTEGSFSNFVFIGRGNGHGVGLSQYGTKDLGDFGYPYDMILKAYFPDAEIVNMSVLE